MANSFTWNPSATDFVFNTAASWVSVNNGNNQTPLFTGSTDNFSILTGATITGLSGLSFGSLTINASGATVSAGAALDSFSGFLTVNNGEVLASQDNGGLQVGVSGTSGVLTVGSAGTIIAGSAHQDGVYFLGGANGSVSTLTGSGEIEADGWLQIRNSLSVVASPSGSLNFQITNNSSQTGNVNAINNGDNVSVLEFDGNVNAGTVTFQGDTGFLLLTGTQVGTGTTLSGGTLGVSVAGLQVGAPGTMLNAIDIATGTGNNGPTSMTGTISGGDTLILTDQSGNHFTIDLVGNYTGDKVDVTPDTSFPYNPGNPSMGPLIGEGLDVYLVTCYAAGAAILTPAGEVSVETLREGDSVITLVDGTHVPQTVKWIGERTLDLTRHPRRESVAPIRLLQGSLGDNLPHRDLVVSPDHAFFLDGGLIPAKLLVNDMTIVRDMAMPSVTYYHVELDQHAILIAEGAAAESYLDTGNRALFSNAGLALLLHPELTINENLRCWEEDACAPLVVRPEQVQPVWQRLAERAQALGYQAPCHATTGDAGLHLMIDGKRVRPLFIEDQTVYFSLPAGAKSVRLVSRAVRPQDLTPWLDDPRQLGVAIRSMKLRGKAGDAVFPAAHPALTAGWHAAEAAEDGSEWRWTNGDALLPVQTDEPCVMEVHLSMIPTYIDDARLAA